MAVAAQVNGPEWMQLKLPVEAASGVRPPRRLGTDQGEAQGRGGAQWLPKLALFSPDGTSVLTAADDTKIRVYDVPLESEVLEWKEKGPGDEADVTSMDPAIVVDEGEAVYGATWYPGMLGTRPETCCFVSASRGHPLHLWDAVSGRIRASYYAMNTADEPDSVFSIAFDKTPSSGRILAGLKKRIAVFRLDRPGTHLEADIPTWNKGSHEGQHGIVSCIDSCELRPSIFAAGSYGKSAAVYDITAAGEQVLVLHGHTGGITHILFSKCGNYLYTGGRRDSQIHCWDIRRACTSLYSLQRETRETNQKVIFDIEPCGRHLASGGTTGDCRFYDLREGEHVYTQKLGQGTVNCVNFHPMLPIMATTAGERVFGTHDEGATGLDAYEDVMHSFDVFGVDFEYGVLHSEDVS